MSFTKRARICDDVINQINMVEIKSNEPEFNAQVISWLIEFLQKGSYPFDTVTSQTSIKAGKATKFPDVQVWLNRKGKQGFCGWELKPPSIPVDDQKLLNNAAEKARTMSADYFVTWNMKDTVIWRTPSNTEEVSRVHRYHSYSALSQITKPDDLWIDFKQELLKARAKEILDDLATIHKEGHLHLIDIDSTFFVHILSEAVKALRPDIHKSLLLLVGKDPKFKKELFAWTAKQGIKTDEASEKYFETISRQIIYRLLGKILFYLTLRRYRTDIPKLDLHGAKPEKISEKLNEYFAKARQIDYQAVFEDDFPDKVPFSKGAIKPLLSLINDLNRYNFSQMPQDVVGTVFEKLIPLEERHDLGQYFTNENLVDLITAFCVRSKTDKVLDPTCGTGTFLMRAYDRLKNYGERDHKKLLSTLWGIDIAHFPAELATINLFKQNLEDYANFPRILSKDFFEVKLNDTFKFPPPKLTDDSDFMIDEKIPLFDGIVGNFPYIRQELIEKRIKGYKSKLETVLSKEWGEEYPELFKNGSLKLSGQADIYAYLFFHAARHLKDDGRIGIVTSNSWLDVAYGYELQKFFLKNFKIVTILESRCEPWFEDASINTIVTILERCLNREERELNNVKFVQIKKKLKHLIPWDMKLPVERWLGLDRLAHTIENSDSDYFKVANGETINTLKGIQTYEDENFRIRVLKQSELLGEVSEAGKTVKWGQYLRAPDVYFEILEKCKDNLVPLKDLADVRFGIKPGVTKFFFLTKEKISHWKIEKNFLTSIIRTPKEAFGISINKKDLKHKMLICSSDLKTVKKYKGLYSYIKWGEKQTTDSGISWAEVPSVKSRKRWYDLGDRLIADGFWPEMYYDSYRVILNNARIYESDKFYGISSKKKKYDRLLIAVLNSSLMNLQREISGFHSLGEGVLKMAVYEVEELLTPQLSKIDKEAQKKILRAFDKLLSRPIKQIFEEVKMKDRQALDSAVLKALGLDPGKYLRPIYDGITQLVKERIDLAKSRGKAKKAKTEKDVEKLKEQVVEEIIPEGPKIFPEEFLDSKYLKNPKEIPVPNETLKMGFNFMGQQEVVSGGGYKYDAKNIDEGKFIVYAQKPGSYLIKIPKERTVIIKAVNKYEKYIKEIKGKLFEEIFNRTHDYKQADFLVNQVLEGFGMREAL